jgi:hypothetical protein
MKTKIALALLLALGACGVAPTEEIEQSAQAIKTTNDYLGSWVVIENFIVQCNTWSLSEWVGGTVQMALGQPGSGAPFWLDRTGAAEMYANPFRFKAVFSPGGTLGWYYNMQGTSVEPQPICIRGFCNVHLGYTGQGNDRTYALYGGRPGAPPNPNDPPSTQVYEYASGTFSDGNPCSFSMTGTMYRP